MSRGQANKSLSIRKTEIVSNRQPKVSELAWTTKRSKEIFIYFDLESMCDHLMHRNFETILTSFVRLI